MEAESGHLEQHEYYTAKHVKEEGKEERKKEEEFMLCVTARLYIRVTIYISIFGFVQKHTEMGKVFVNPYDG